MNLDSESLSVALQSTLNPCLGFSCSFKCEMLCWAHNVSLIWTYEDVFHFSLFSAVMWGVTVSVDEALCCIREDLTVIIEL